MKIQISTLIHREDPILEAEDSESAKNFLTGVALDTEGFSYVKPAGTYTLHILPPESYSATATTK